MEGSHDRPSKPEFFKVLLPDLLIQLPIPKAFIKNIIKEQCRNATLLSPLGKPWCVEIHGDAHTMHFRRGWREFSQAHHLHVGYFLIFSYEGNMVFSITVFDLSGCKKEYSVVDKKGMEQEMIDLEDEQDRNTECISKSFGRRLRPGAHSRESTPAELLNSLRSNSQRCGVKRHAETGTNSPHHFEVIMRPNHVSGQFKMRIPVAYKVSYGLSKPREVILRNPDGRSWTVVVRHVADDGVLNYRPYFGKGWRRFVRESRLAVGDKCVFELLCKNKKKVIILVHVLK